MSVHVNTPTDSAQVPLFMWVLVTRRSLTPLCSETDFSEACLTIRWVEAQNVSEQLQIRLRGVWWSHLHPSSVVNLKRRLNSSSVSWQGFGTSFCVWATPCKLNLGEKLDWNLNELLRKKTQTIWVIFQATNQNMLLLFAICESKQESGRRCAKPESYNLLQFCLANVFVLTISSAGN